MATHSFCSLKSTPNGIYGGIGFGPDGKKELSEEAKRLRASNIAKGRAAGKNKSDLRTKAGKAAAKRCEIPSEEGSSSSMNGGSSCHAAAAAAAAAAEVATAAVARPAPAARRPSADEVGGSASDSATTAAAKPSCQVEAGVEGAEPEPEPRLEYEVERLLRERPIANSDRWEYLVQWVGWKEPTWEPEEHLTASMIKDFRHEQDRAGAGQSEGGQQKRPSEESEGTVASEFVAKPPKQHAAPAARRAKPAEQLFVPERSKREKKTPRPYVAEPAPSATALRRYALEMPHLKPSEATDALCSATVVGGQRVSSQGTKLAAARTKKRAAEPGTAAAGEAGGKAPKTAKAPGAEARAPAEYTDEAAAEATVVAAAQAAGVTVSGVASPETSVAAWPAAWTEAVDDEEDELDAGRRARQAKREEQRLRQKGVADAKPSDTAANPAATTTTPDEPDAAVTTLVAAPGTKRKRTAKLPAATEGVDGSSFVCEICAKSFAKERGLRTHRNFCKDDGVDGPRPGTAQQASTALVVALPAGLALTTSQLALDMASWRPDDEISEDMAAHAEQTRRENEKLVVALEEQKLSAVGEQLRNVEAQLQRAMSDQDLANEVVLARGNQLMLRDQREAMELSRSSVREAQAGFDEKLSELNDTDEQQKECKARLHTLLRNAAAEEPKEAALALQAQENDRAVPAMLAETRAASCVARLEEM